MTAQVDLTTRCATIALAVVGHGDIGTAITDVLDLPPDLAARGILATGLLEAAVRSSSMVDLRHLRRLRELLEIAAEPAPPTPQWIRTRTTARLLCLMVAVLDQELTDCDDAKARVDHLWAEGGADPTLTPLFDSVRMALKFLQALQEDDPGAIARLPSEMQQFVGDAPKGNRSLRSLGSWLTAATELMATQRRGADVADPLRRLTEVAADLPFDNLRTLNDEFLSACTTMLPAQATHPSGDTRRLTDAQLDQLVTEAEPADRNDLDRALRHAAVAMAALRGGQETDLGRIDIGVAQLRRALALAASMQSRQRVMYLSGLAVGLYRRHEITNSTADLREAERLLEESHDLLSGPGDPQWQMINDMLSRVRQLLGTDPGFHRPAVDGLRAHLWQVLLQPDPVGVAAAVRDAASDAVSAARQCLTAEDLAGAIGALDAGRGLALFAATEIRSAGDRLDDLGATDLARRWRAAVAEDDPAKLATDLRREVFTTLAAQDEAAELLAPPTLTEIQSALAALQADALVYLVPGDGPYPGHLIAAPQEGPPSFLVLPELRTEGNTEVDRYLTSLARRDAAVRDVDTESDSDTKSESDSDTKSESDSDTKSESDTAELSRSLDALCDWAWRAAIRPLVETYLPRLPQPVNRPPRVVLIPMGDLARIPWQAARDRQGRYAVERIALSQAASARMLCRSAALAPVASSAVGLLVGDPPTGRLLAARVEGYAIRGAFYPGARYLGQRPDGSISPSGPGTREQVADWLTNTDPGAGTMLHLACHGLVRTEGDEATAYLQLAYGGQLTATELIGLMTRAPERAVGLVVLAACSSGRSFTGFDEAYSLGTAFLAGGSRSVLSSQWNIDDIATAAFMFMFHRFLRIEKRPPWAALRDAQLWMLAPGRDVPADMPPPLRAQLREANLTGIESWAAFVHWGQ